MQKRNEDSAAAPATTHNIIITFIDGDGYNSSFCLRSGDPYL